MKKNPVVVCENEELFECETEYGVVEVPVYAVGVEADTYEEAYELAKRRARPWVNNLVREQVEGLEGMLWG